MKALCVLMASFVLSVPALAGKMECKASYTYGDGWQDVWLREISVNEFLYESAEVNLKVTVNDDWARLKITDHKNSDVVTESDDSFVDKGFVQLQFDSRDRGLSHFRIVNLMCSQYFRGDL